MAVGGSEGRRGREGVSSEDYSDAHRGERMKLTVRKLTPENHMLKSSNGHSGHRQILQKPSNFTTLKC